MKLRFLYDIGMFIVFMTIYSVFNPFIATYALLGMATLKMAIALSGKEAPKKLDWVEFALLTAFCIATLVFHAAIFLKIKAPLLGVLFAGGMVAYILNTKESFMKTLFEKDFELPHMPASAWKKIDYMVITNILIKAAIVSTIIFVFSDTVWYYSNFVLPLFDLTTMAGMYLVGNPYFKKEEERLELDATAPTTKPPLLIEKAIQYARTFTPFLILHRGLKGVHSAENTVSPQPNLTVSSLATSQLVP